LGAPQRPTGALREETPLGGIFDSLFPFAGAMGAGINALSQGLTNRQNEGLMRESWARDDNAVQRRAEDLEKAGMNPLLAAGGAAQSGSPIQLRAPEYGNVAEGAIKGAQAAKDVSLTEAQGNLMQANARKANVEADAMEKTYTDKDGLSINYSDTYGRKLYNDYIQAALSAGAANYKNEKGGYERDINYDQAKKDFFLRHSEELQKNELDIQKAGLTGARADNERRSLTNRLLQKDLKWYGADKVIGAVSKVGGFALSGTRAARSILSPW
jgi:hypothetical protein